MSEVQEIAERIVTGVSVDWSAELETAADRELILTLRQLSIVVDSHRNLYERTAPRNLANTRWAELEIRQKVGEGAFAEVFLANDTTLKRDVALKLLHPELRSDADLTERILTEGRLLAKIDHPHVVTVYGVADDEGRVGLWMEYLEGETLFDMVARNGARSDREAANIGIELTQALAAIHACGVVHRDIKAQNIIRRRHGGRVVVADFGIATKPGRPDEGDVTIGTPLYAAPEVLRGQPSDRRSDLYSLGVLLYYLVSSKYPVRASSLAELRDAHERRDRVPLRDARPDVDPRFAALVDRALDPEPGRRFQTAGEMERALQDTIVRKKRRQWRRRHLLLAAGALGVVAAVLPRPPSPTAPVPKLVVLPLDAESASTRELAPILTEAVTRELHRDARLDVFDYSTVLEFCRLTDCARTEPAHLLKGLGADIAVTGRIEDENDRVELTANVHSRTGFEFRATAEAPLDTRLLAATALSRSVVENLGLAREERPAARDTLDPAAHAAYVRALELYGHGRTENLHGAIEQLRSSIQLEPDFAPPRAMLARLLVTQFFQGGDHALITSAAEQVEIAERIDPGLPEVHIAIGQLEQVRGNSVEAEAALQKALALAPGSDTAYRTLGYLYEDTGRLGEARGAFEQAVAMRPTVWLTHYALARFLYVKMSELDEASYHAELAERYNRDDLAPKLLLGSLWVDQGDFGRAVEKFQEARAFSSHPMVFSNLGRAHYLRGHYVAATKAYREAVEAAPGDPRYHYLLFRALNRIDSQRDAARETLLTARDLYASYLAQHQDAPEYRGDMAVVLATLGECALATEEMEKTLAELPSSASAAQKAAEVGIACEDLPTAIHYAVKAIESGGAVTIENDPVYALVREDPRVSFALQRAGADTE